MTQLHLHSYLNGHLAGSVVALELLDQLRDSAASDDRQFFTTLREEIAADQRVLQALLRDVGGEESRLRKAGAWLTEKVGELKLRVEDPAGSGLRLLEALETLALGIQGKLALWAALETVTDRVKEVGGIDLPHLKQRARDQHGLVEARRLVAAREVLSVS